MALKIYFDSFVKQTEETLTQRVQFVFSPLNELFRSLHILLNPRHHGLHMAWIIKAQQQMTKELYADLQYFRLLYELGTPTIFLPCVKRFVLDLDVDIELLAKDLKQADPADLVARLREIAQDRENAFIPELAKGIEWGGFELTSNDDLLDDLVQKPDEVFARLFRFIAAYRAQIYDSYWQEAAIEQKILAEIERATLDLQQNGFQAALNQLQIERMTYQGGVLQIYKPFDEEIRLTSSEVLLFAPSYFTWPHLFVERFSRGVFISYSLTRQAGKALEVGEMSRLFFALSDDARLQLLWQLETEPNTTQALAQLLSLTAPAISKALHILREAGLVERDKQGKYVFYRTSSLFSEVVPLLNRLQQGGKAAGNVDF